MNIFLSYASQDRALVDPVRLALAAQGHDVFFDREDLPPGEEYDSRIRGAIEECDLFIYFLSPDSVDAGSYTLSELAIAERCWPHPSGRVLPVLLRPLPFEQIPAYLRAVTLFEPAGNLTACVADFVHRTAAARRRKRWTAAALVAGVAVVIGVAALLYLRDRAPVGADGAPAVLVAGGAFVMGDDEFSPMREVYVSPFYIDMYEVTAARYAKYLDATGAIAPPSDWESVDLQRHGELPVVAVTWSDADAYCRWAGKRLPTEAEWEKAARGDGRTYPWGSGEPTAEHAVFARDAESAYDGGLAAVGSHPSGRSVEGVYDLAGNAAEWAADWYAEGFSRSDVRDPRGPDSGPGKVMRGGGWRDSADRLRATRRFFLREDQWADDVGFRCARDAE